jgi:hypothetical protein
MLQTVIGDDDIDLRMKREQRLSSSDPIASHPHWAIAALRKQDRLIAYRARLRVYGHCGAVALPP